MSEPKATHQCPDCNHPPYADPRGLSTHRRIVHGTPGVSKSALQYKAAKKAKPVTKLAKPVRLSAQMESRKKLYGKFQCPHCRFVAAWTGGLTKHIAAKHPTTTIEQTTEGKPNESTPQASQIARVTRNGHRSAEANTRRSLIPEAAIAFTAGRVEELLSRTAQEYDLPARTFAAGVIELIYAKTLRQ